MAKSETTNENYEDYRTHLAKQPHDILIAWGVAGCLALGVILGSSDSVSHRLGAESPVDAGAKLLPRATLVIHGEEATLADEIGMIPKPKK